MVVEDNKGHHFDILSYLGKILIQRLTPTSHELFGETPDMRGL